MNAFQILDKENNPISINELDQQAAEFWNVEIHPKWYASPSETSGNWYDNIGWYIANQGHCTSGWNNVKVSMITSSMESAANRILKGEQTDASIQVIMEWYKPYYDLIDHWEALGYQPKQIK